MQCPRCGAKIKVGKIVSSFKGGADDFDDVNCKIHHHEPYPPEREWVCVNGHKGIIRSSNKCKSCNYGKGQKIIIKK